MKVLKLELEKYRNFKKEEVLFDEKINVIYGENAQGKTNLLEAVWLLTGARSFRGTKDKDILMFGEKKAYTKGTIKEKDEENSQIKIKIEDGKREAQINGVKRGSAQSIIGTFKAVIFSPEHLSLIKGGPENRRKFLDAAICQIKPSYTKTLVKYAKTLKHRNFLLREIKKDIGLKDTIDAWDKKLSEYAGKIIYERIKYIKKLNAKTKEIYLKISKNEDFEIKYKDFEKIYELSELEISKTVKENLFRFQESDILKGMTSIGPHRDDIQTYIGGKNTKLFASQGQQRSGVIAMKLAEAQIIDDITHESPVILLDDILSELDESRQKQIFKISDGHQIFITGCEKPAIEEGYKGFRVKNGNVFPD